MIALASRPARRARHPFVNNSAASPDLLEDFSTYTSTANFLSDPRGIWENGEGLNTDKIVLDTTVGYGSSTKSMRYDWPNNGANCTSYNIRPGFLTIPGSLTHLWIEYVVRFGNDFDVDAGAVGCAAEYKLASLGDYPNGIGRWDIAEMQAGQWVTGHPNGVTGSGSGAWASPNALWDESAVVFRVEAKLHDTDGILRFAVNDVTVRNSTNIDTKSATHSAINVFGPGLNLNQGPAVATMTMWWHKIAVYNTDPEWSW